MVTWKGLSLTSEVIEAVRGQRPSSEAKKAWRGGFFAKAFFIKFLNDLKTPRKVLTFLNILYVFQLLVSEEDLLQPLQRKWNLIQAHTAAPAATEAVQKQNIRPTPRTNLQLPERVVYLTHRMRTLHLDTLAKIHIKTKSPTILIISKLMS